MCRCNIRQERKRATPGPTQCQNASRLIIFVAGTLVGLQRSAYPLPYHVINGLLIYAGHCTDYVSDVRINATIRISATNAYTWHTKPQVKSIHEIDESYLETASYGGGHSYSYIAAMYSKNEYTTVLSKEVNFMSVLPVLWHLISSAQARFFWKYGIMYIVQLPCNLGQCFALCVLTQATGSSQLYHAVD